MAHRIDATLLICPGKVFHILGKVPHLLTTKLAQVNNRPANAIKCGTEMEAGGQTGKH